MLGSRRQFADSVARRRNRVGCE